MGFDKLKSIFSGIKDEEQPLFKGETVDGVYMPSFQRALDGLEDATYGAHANTGKIDVDMLKTHLKTVAAELDLDERIGRTPTGKLKKSAPSVELKGEVSAGLESIMKVVINHKNWKTEEGMNSILDIIPEQLKRVQFEGGCNNIAQMVAMEKDKLLQAQYAENKQQAAQGKKKVTKTISLSYKKANETQLEAEEAFGRAGREADSQAQNVRHIEVPPGVTIQ